MPVRIKKGSFRKQCKGGLEPKMKIVFFVSEDKSLGVGYLSSYLKQHGHQVYLLFDSCQFAKSYVQNERLARYFSKEKYFLKRIRDIRPDLIGFSVLTSNYQWALRLSRLIKQYFNIPVIFGGVHPTLVPDRVIKETAIDMVCVGEAEEALLELSDNFGKNTNIKNVYFKDNGQVISNSLRPLEQDLDKYPFPDEELFYEILPDSYRITSSVITSRGCPYYCTFCSNHSLAALYKGQRYLRRRSADNVLAELYQRKHKFKSRHFVFVDDIFASDDTDWLERFIPRYKKEINLPFNCLAHPDLVSERTISLLKDGGCTTIDFGLQSGSERLRRDVLYRFETNESIRKIALACKRHKLHFAVDQILNIPTETEEDILSSARLFNAIRPDIINCSSLLYFPKALIIDKARKAGLLDTGALEQIEDGKVDDLYSSASISPVHKNSLSFYRKYALLLNIIPLLPKRIMSLVINNVRSRNIISKIPLSILPLVRVFVDLKGGLGFIPFSVLRNEMFYLKQHLRYQRYMRGK